MRDKQKKKKAIHLRRNGKSYNEISRDLNIPKSTLASWFKKIKWNQKIIKKIWNNKRKQCVENITQYNKKRARIIKEEHLRLQKENQKTIKKLSNYELKLIGSALYWAEGSKNNRWVANFVNSDSQMIKVMMRFFKEVCKIPDEKFSFKIQIHPNISEKSAKLFWAKILDISINKFTKTLYQVSKASKGKRSKRTLPYGTCRITIANVYLRNQLQGWIQGITDQVFRN